ncbi:hypothetical protein [Microbacterium sp. USHLN272]|uniref:hypothetical protein n=1 Tax=Microbacterium sp. USHLN272 TaxID=3081287 RepID=UPI0030187241
MGGAITKVDIGHGRGWLEEQAAKSQARIDRALGHPQQITEAGRSWEQQNAHWLTFQKYGKPIALHPDTPSVHQKGRAKDTDERDVALMNDHGWFQTVYRVVNGKRTLVEPWHFEYDPARDNHRHEVVELVNDNGTWRIAPDKEWDEMATQKEMEAAFRKVVAEEVVKVVAAEVAKAVKQNARSGAYKIVGVQGPPSNPGPHMKLTGPEGETQLAPSEMHLVRRHVQATPYVSDTPWDPKSKFVTGEELFTPDEWAIVSKVLARMKPAKVS